MSIGGGKYEMETTEILRDHGADAVIVIVSGGALGSGFSVAMHSPLEMAKLTVVLRQVADQIDADLRRLKQ